MKWLGIAVMVASAALFVSAVIVTRHWPMAGDAFLTHYSAFLLDRGFAPYRDIININTPGCLLFDWGVIHIVGPGSVAWRIVDVALLAISTCAMVVIAKPYAWAAGLAGGAILFAIHVRDGIDQAGERDLILAALLLVACACVFEALRRDQAIDSLISGLAAGAGLLIKPTAAIWILGVVLLEGYALRKKPTRMGRHLSMFVLGNLVSLTLALLFLHRYHAVGAFIDIARGLVVYHAGVDRLSTTWLLAHPIPSAWFPVALAWIYLAVVVRGWNKFEKSIVIFSIAFGVASFVLQGKGFPYHRYPAEAFLLLALGIDAAVALRARGTQRVVAATVLIYALGVLAPESVVRASRYDWKNQDFSHSLTADLDSLGGARLSGTIQCMDTFGGCIGTLYNMKLVQATGFLYDCYFFHQPQSAVSTAMRTRFLSAMEASPPNVIVVTNQYCFTDPGGYHKLDTWPAFLSWLGENYDLHPEMEPGRDVNWWPHPRPEVGYRIYLRRAADPRSEAIGP
jgi:Dolichyl-phosphate-mannose-protein mannosyltransferase